MTNNTAHDWHAHLTYNAPKIGPALISRLLYAHAPSFGDNLTTWWSKAGAGRATVMEVWVTHCLAQSARPAAWGLSSRRTSTEPHAQIAQQVCPVHVAVEYSRFDSTRKDLSGAAACVHCFSCFSDPCCEGFDQDAMLSACLSKCLIKACIFEPLCPPCTPCTRTRWPPAVHALW